MQVITTDTMGGFHVGDKVAYRDAPTKVIGTILQFAYESEDFEGRAQESDSPIFVNIGQENSPLWRSLSAFVKAPDS